MTASEKPWTPDMPLRADATDEQIEEREEHLCAHHGPGPHNRKDGTGCFACANVARELASAVSLEKEALLKAITKACEIIETGDARVMAHEGPINEERPELSLLEWRRLYHTLDRARKSHA